MLGFEAPKHMNGVDLSPLFAGTRPRRRRTYRTSSYSDHVNASDGRWLLISDNRGRDKRLYRIGREGRNVAGRYPRQVRRMWRLIKRDAGPKGLPRFPA
jgi:hypothetical protein